MSRWLSAIAVAISLSGSALAGFPSSDSDSISDEELVKQPIIVVAHWEIAPVIRADLDLGTPAKVGKRSTLIVTRVVAGDITPGNYEVVLGPSVYWSEEYPRDVTGTPFGTDNTLDAGKPNLWFLKRGHRIKGDTREYLYQDKFGGVRDARAEPYFRALRSTDPEGEVRKLLGSRDMEMVQLVLEWICNGEIPWPLFEDDLPIRPFSPSGPAPKPRIENLATVEVLLNHSDPELRRAAICILGKWRGKASLLHLRHSLTDPAPNVRTMAVVMLASLDDRESSEAIIAAVQGIDEYASEVICALAVWKNLAVVPALIGYLEDDGEGMTGEGLNPRCLLARAALEQITGHKFPLDVDVATRIWRPASKLADAGRREAFLDRVLREEPVPLSAELVRDGDEFAVVVTNTSPRPVSLAKTPQSIDLSYDIKLPNGSRNGGIGGGFDEMAEIDGKESFVELAPGDSIRFSYKVEEKEDFILAGPASRKLELSYQRNGHEYGLKAWVGTIKASTDSIESAK